MYGQRRIFRYQNRVLLLLKFPMHIVQLLKEQKLELRLYRIADITKTGEYRDLEKYSGLNIQELSVESSAREYKKKAEDVAALSWGYRME